MLARHPLNRALLVAVWAGALALYVRPGYAAPNHAKESHGCVAAFKNAQKQEQSGHLREAQKSFSQCAKATCGMQLRRECMIRFDQLVMDVPSVVPVVTDASGEPVLEVQVTMDGEQLTSKIDGRAVAVDPGLHEFTFISPSGTSTQKIVILQGQRNRPLSISLGSERKTKQALAASAVNPSALVDYEPAPEPVKRAMVEAPPGDEPPARSRSSRGSKVPYLLTGVGLAGVTGYALMTYWGRKDNDMLVQCSPNCMQQSVDHVRKLYLVANVSLGVGVAALGAATWLFVRSYRNDREARSAMALDLHPLSSGALASVRGGF
jgi:hypothetical protein